MCFDIDAQPPIQPLLGSDAYGQDLTLTSADGTQFLAYHAHPDAKTATHAGIIVLPDVRGLFQFYKDLALRFAEAGVDAIAIDYFGRTAGLTERDENFEYMPHVQQTKPEQIKEDVAAAIAQLRGQGGAGPAAIFTVGFCFGGSNSFMQAANKQGLAGVIGFYGRPMGGFPPGATGPIQRVNEFTCPVLGLFGGADQGIPTEQTQAFDEALTGAGVEHDIVIYPGAPHSFFDRRYAEYAKESADSWQRMLAFIQAHTPQQ